MNPNDEKIKLRRSKKQ